MKERIVVCIEGGMTREALKILSEAGEVTVSDFAALPKNIAGATVLIVGVHVRVDGSLMEKSESLKLIATPATGTDHIDLTEAKKRGIEVISLQGQTESLRWITGTAELAFGLLLSLMRRIPSASQSVLDSRWKREDFCGHSLFGKTLGIIGVGRLGTLMARYGVAFGMRVIGYDLKPSSSSHCEYVTLPVLLRQSDVVSLHVPLNDQTEEMIGNEEIKQMKSGAVLINTSRGKVVNEAAVLGALRKGTLAGYATDVLADELEFPRRMENHPLIEYAKTHDTVVITPHIGGMTVESRAMTDMFIAKKIIENLKQVN